MLLTHDDEQRSLRVVVRDFLAQHSPEVQVRRLMDTTAGYDPGVWQQMAKMDLLGLGIPEEFGGAGFGWPERAIALEEMGRVLLCAPYLSSLLAASTLLEAQDTAACRRHLPGIASGSTIATVVTGDHAGAGSARAEPVRAHRAREGWQLTGVRWFVLDGHIADLILVFAETPDGPGLFVLDAHGAGVQSRELDTVDRTRRQARVELRAASAERVECRDGASLVRERVSDYARVAIAAEQVGAADRVLAMSVDYAKARTQFGRPIGSFQAIKHKCADMLIQVETARCAAEHAVWALARSPRDAPVAACLAAGYCAEAFLSVAAANIQVHGGIGFTWEHPAHLYFRRAKTSQLLLGHPTEHREQLVQRLAATA